MEFLGINGLLRCNIHAHQMLKGLKGLKKNKKTDVVYSASYKFQFITKIILIQVCQVSNLHKNKAFHKIKIEKCC